MTFKDSEKGKRYQREYRKTHTRQRKEWSRQYYINNKSRINIYSKQRHIAHRVQEKKARDQLRLDNPYRFWAKTVISNHRQSGYPVSLSVDELENLARKTTLCPICDSPLDYSGKAKSPWNQPSLDRKNNDNEINSSNSWIICRKSNTIKCDLPMQSFVEYCKKVVARFGAELD